MKALRNKLFIGFTVLTLALVITLGVLKLVGGNDTPQTKTNTPTTTQPKAQTSAPKDTYRVKGYQHGAVCAAITPSCGYCPGEVIGSDCYVTQSQIDDFKKQYGNIQVH